jgi:site-specific recombinase XerD
MNTDFTDIPHISASTSIPAAMKMWIIYLSDQGKSNYTIKAFSGDLGLLTKFLPPDIVIGDISTHDLNHFIDWLEQGRGKNIPCSPKSLSRRITTLKSFFKWLFDHGRISNDPAEKVVQKSVISPLPQVLNANEIDLVIAAAEKYRFLEKPDLRPTTLLKLLLETGIKKSECLYLKPSHFETSGENYLFVRYADGKDRNKERKIPLSNEFVEIYQAYLDQYKPSSVVFPWSPRRLEYILEDISKDAGIEKHLSFSMCRWNSALIDWENEVEKETIRQKLGISKIQWREINIKLQKLSQLAKESS